ncbi:MAG: carboxymuconolactone decarboxylase family protein [Anaerolineales bacterium]
MTQEQIDGLASAAANVAYSEQERLVLRYAEQLTTKADTDEGLYEELKKHFSDREIVELAVTVATANFTNRINRSLKTELEH